MHTRICLGSLQTIYNPPFICVYIGNVYRQHALLTRAYMHRYYMRIQCPPFACAYVQEVYRRYTIHYSYVHICATYMGNIHRQHALLIREYITATIRMRICVGSLQTISNPLFLSVYIGNVYTQHAPLIRAYKAATMHMRLCLGSLQTKCNSPFICVCIVNVYTQHAPFIRAYKTSTIYMRIRGGSSHTLYNPPYNVHIDIDMCIYTIKSTIHSCIQTS